MKKRQVFLILASAIIVLFIVIIVPPRAATLIHSIEKNWDVKIPMADSTVYEKNNRTIDGIQYEIFYYKDRTDVENNFNWHKISDDETREAETYFDILGIRHQIRPDYKNADVYVKKQKNDTN